MHFIYHITIQTNNKKYVGQSKSPSKRWAQHQLDARKENPTMLVGRAIKKYGVANCVFTVIASCLNQQAANEAELTCIQQESSHISTGRGYNVTLGGDSAPKTEQWKEKMRAYWSKPEWKDNQIKLITRAKENATTEEKELIKKKLSEILRGRHLSPSTEFKNGHQVSLETKEKISLKKKNKEPWNLGMTGKANQTSFQPGQESWLKGTVGVARNQHQLDDETVIKIYYLIRNGINNRQEIMKEFNLSDRAVRNIMAGRTYSYLKLPKCL